MQKAGREAGFLVSAYPPPRGEPETGRCREERRIPKIGDAKRNRSRLLLADAGCEFGGGAKMLKAMVAGCVLALGLCAPATAATYNLSVLSSLGGTSSAATGINNAGQVVGWSNTTGDVAQRAVIWNGTTPTVLGSLGGAVSQATAINSAGQVVGWSYTPGFASTEAVVWNGTTPAVLGSLAGPPNINFANAINNSGQVVGAGGLSSQAILWNGTAPTGLASLGGAYNEATGINNAGQVVGVAQMAGGASQQAVVWNGTTPTVLDSLGGGGAATAINNSGQIVGYSYRAGGGPRLAVVWNGTTPTELESLGGLASVAAAINDAGLVVGYSRLASGEQHGVIWNGTTALDINTLLASGPSGLVIASLTGINASGQIVGYAFDSLGNQVAVLLTPLAETPLPAALPLLASGLGALWFAGRRRNRKAASSAGREGRSGGAPLVLPLAKQAPR